MIKEIFKNLFFPSDNKKEHFKSLDGLRGVAVLLVLLSHSSHEKLFFHEFVNFEKFGKVGVYLFFVLSAYLLDRQIALAFLTKKASKKYWKNYFLRRFLRIYPLFFIALMIYGLLNLIGFPTVINQILDIPAHMLLLRGESIFWSIPVEFKYYFISPLIMWFCHKYLNWDKLKTLLCFSVIIFVTIIIEYIFHLPLVSTFRYFPIFMIGTFLSIYEILYGKKQLTSTKPIIFTIIDIVSVFLIIISVPFYFEKLFGFHMDFHSSIFYLPFAILWGLILVSAKYGKGIIQKILEFKLLRFIGTISFSMYLFHMIFLDFVIKLGIPQNSKIYLFFLLSIIFSSFSFLFIERPLSKIKLYPNAINKKEVNEQTTIKQE
jgi:peptidoglycan/LPS O-acetylase OafA/YrhL